jgi:hypothetical protein
LIGARLGAFSSSRLTAVVVGLGDEVVAAATGAAVGVAVRCGVVDPDAVAGVFVGGEAAGVDACNLARRFRRIYKRVEDIVLVV